MDRKFNIDLIQKGALLILHGVGEDVNREGLLETPKRFAKAMRELFTPEPFNLTTFENEGCDEMVVVRDIPFYSLCEHHLLPFFGTATVAYIPDKKIVGLSKLPRAVQKFAKGVQNQERITESVSAFLMNALEPQGVGVILKARHMCMEMRGVKCSGSETITSSLKGLFKTDEKTRAEFMSLRK